ncbi:cytidylyltransferase domain-containing protein [Fervidibacillus albus]|uniref:Acylneuraminate cytidylyltransferase family protein n=1 Tax=Fervidibacillus albus TaxID=2980026 RepID=A0A9E8LUY0_9BACI|nr:acylneuraminate cytidylyltransferase family protein [Fervidibacillus albus]WAA09800.1 acylneuraminate cytidylyltransferase family protein [Fervidibacillus albus]
MKPTFLAIIPARGGSKGVPRKNIRKIAGKPLIAWTIEEAKKSQYITRLILSSEDDEIIKVAKRYGCEVPFVRPKEIAQDDTPGIDPVLHAIQQCPGYDYVVLLQPTSPLRTVEDIDGCIEYMLKKNAEFCVSVTAPDKSPYWMYIQDDVGKIKPIINQTNIPTRRQDLPKTIAINGAVYVAKTDKIIEERTFLTPNTFAYEMERGQSLDIDTEWDFKVCEFFLNQRIQCDKKE